MRGRITIGLIVLLVAGAASPALAKKKKKDIPKSIFVPERMTAGDANNMMGALAPDGEALYFVSDENITTEIFAQDPIGSGARVLFDENADTSQPRVSPNGKWLAYISYQRDSNGDVCLRDLTTGEHHCRTGLKTADLSLEWAPTGKKLLVLQRDGVDGAMKYVALDPSPEGGKTQVLAQADMLSPALYPDASWIAYVPLAPASDNVGVGFSQKSTRGLSLYKRGGKTKLYRPDLPGASNQPAFSADGTYLYFVQYLNDTNNDGSIDGDDNAIVFRVEFDRNADHPTFTSTPEQMTSARWSCMYPRHEDGSLLLTCSREGSLDIYRLPEFGMVPREWDGERLRGEVRVARDHWTKLLLLGRLLALEPKKEAQVEVLRQMTALHLELREYASATYYTRQIQRLAGAQNPMGVWAKAMGELIALRDFEVELSQGMLSDQFLGEVKKRLSRLEKLSSKNTDSNLAALIHMVQAEAQSLIGRKGAARTLLDTIQVEALTDPIVIHTCAQSLTEFAGFASDYDSQLDLLQKLATHTALSGLERLQYSDKFIRHLHRGLAPLERLKALGYYLSQVDPQSELAMMIQVAELLLNLTDEAEEEVRKGIFTIYKGNKDPDRRKALVLSTIKVAARKDNEYLQYQFATTWASGVKKAHPERKYAESLYRQVVLERAYTEWTKGEIGEARGYFFQTTMTTPSLEAHIGFIETWITEGRKDIEGHYKKTFKKKPDDPVYKFVKSYMKARTLGSIEDRKAHEKAVTEALAELKPATKALPRSLEVQQLWGFLLHQRFLRQGDGATGVAALSHYLLALDLARENPRYEATILQQLGLLQAGMGNHRIALSYYDARQRLPFVRPESELSYKMAVARSLYQVGRAGEALARANESRELVAANPELARFDVLVADRSALYAKDAEKWDVAYQHYQEVAERVDGSGAGENRLVQSPINKLKNRIGKVSSSIGGGNFEEALKVLDEVDALLAEGGSLRPADADRTPTLLDEYIYDRTEYRVVAAGLRAQANRGLRRFNAATLAMTARQDLYKDRFSNEDMDEDLLDMAVCSYHMGEYAYQTNNLKKAEAYFQQGLRWTAEYNERTGSIVNDVGRRLLQAYAELHLYGKLDLDAFSLDLQQRLAVAYDFMCENPSPNWESDRFLLGLYLTMLEVGSG